MAKSVAPNNNGNPGTLGGFNFSSPSFGPFPQVNTFKSATPGDPNQVAKNAPTQAPLWTQLLTPPQANTASLAKSMSVPALKIRTGNPGGLGQ
jgi:hypothetical protein